MAKPRHATCKNCGRPIVRISLDHPWEHDGNLYSCPTLPTGSRAEPTDA